MSGSPTRTQPLRGGGGGAGREARPAAKRRAVASARAVRSDPDKALSRLSGAALIRPYRTSQERP